MTWAGSENSVGVFVAPRCTTVQLVALCLLFSVKIEVMFLLWAGCKISSTHTCYCFLKPYFQAFWNSFGLVSPCFCGVRIERMKNDSTIFLWFGCLLISKLLEPTCVFCWARRWSTWTWLGFEPLKTKVLPCRPAPQIPRLNSGP